MNRFEIYRWGMHGSSEENFGNLFELGDVKKAAYAAATEGCWDEVLRSISPPKGKVAILVYNDMDVDGVLCDENDFKDTIAEILKDVTPDGDSYNIYWKYSSGKVERFSAT
jgi:hypothetical protein